MQPYGQQPGYPPQGYPPTNSQPPPPPYEGDGAAPPRFSSYQGPTQGGPPAGYPPQGQPPQGYPPQGMPPGQGQPPRPRKPESGNFRGELAAKLNNMNISGKPPAGRPKGRGPGGFDRANPGVVSRQQGKGGAMHSYSEAERRAFVEHINTLLEGKPNFKPVNPNDDSIFNEVRTGSLLWYASKQHKLQKRPKILRNAWTQDEGLFLCCFFFTIIVVFNLE